MTEALAVLHNRTLAEIQDGLDDVNEMIENPATPEEMRQELRKKRDEIVRVELPRKVDAVAGYLRHCKKQAQIAKEIAEHALAGMQRWAKREEDLRNIVRAVMQVSGTKTYKGALSVITLCEPRESVEVFSLGELPLEYFHPLKPPKLAPDLDRIKRDLKAEIEVPGARLITGDDVLMVR